MKNNDEMPHNPFSLIADFDGDISSLFSQEVEPVLPVLPLRNMMLFPGVVAPVSVGRPASLKLVSQVAKSGGLMAVVCQKDAEVEFPGLDDLYNVGVVAKAVRVLELPDGTTTVILQSYGRVALNALTRTKPYLRAQVTPLDDVLPEDDDKEFEAVSEACKDLTLRWLKLNEQFREEASFAIRNIKHPIFLTSFICTNMPFSIKEKAEILEEGDHKQRAFKLLSILNRECQYAHLKASIQNRTREELDQQQKEYFLQQQIKNIQDELGDNGNEDVKQLREKAEKLNMPEAIKKQMQKELAKLERINPQSPDYNVQVVYLQTVFSLPWGTKTDDDMRLETAEKVLNRDHYGMEKVKERVLEYLAVLPHRRSRKAPILCLYGPPGVGKTSLGKSVAEALGRKYVRISLGGVHDEAEIRGHRKTYIGAMPGRIIKSLSKAGSSNPVIILDEIDKLGSDHRGDPSSAMLEVLDPEQNNTFHDNYLDVDYDLSKVMFIATANNLGTIPPALLDRMELIEVSGYITEEKIEIARRHLVPKELKNNGLKKENVKISKAALEYIIENHTRESGVRELEKKINKVMRKIALDIARGSEQTVFTIKPADVSHYLGVPEYSRDKYQGNDYAGVVTGLAWTAVGGEILFVETSLSKGKGGKLTLTGNLGDVMKESAMLALEYLKAHTLLLDLPEGIFENWNIHVHVPEGAIPKDGPSAGITMVTSLASALTQRKVKPNLAMTGEITLRGKVLPVGGIKEKILAAKRAGIKDIILCEENRKNIEDIQPMYLTGLNFHYVNDIKEVLALALTDEKVKGAIDFCSETNTK